MRKSFLTRMVLVGMFVLAACGATPTASPDTTTENTGKGAAASTEALQGTLAISGAFALYPMMTVWAEEFQKIHPDVTFDVQVAVRARG